MDESKYPPEDPRHVCGMFCDGQDGSNSDCARRRRAAVEKSVDKSNEPTKQQPMSNEERLRKLEQAVSLIREVEFSYESGSQERSAFYHFVANHCSFLGFIGQNIFYLKTIIRNSKG